MIPSKKTILIVDDAPESRDRLTDVLKDAYQVWTADNAEIANHTIHEKSIDLVLLDIRMQGTDSGKELLKALRVHHSRADLPIIMVSDLDNQEGIAECFDDGANDYIIKDQLHDRVMRARIENALALSWAWLKHDVEKLAVQPLDMPENSSPAWQKAWQTACSFALGEVPIFIAGETGTGKSHMARLLHEQSPRRAEPFWELNCAAIPSELLESEMFGYVRGAFTGALRSYDGKFRLANKGTLFLDEVGELTPQHQSKLLQALRPIVTGTTRCVNITPVGGDKSFPVDVRIIAATNQNLDDLVAQGRFRRDLYYRLGADSPVELPPLRERFDDLEALANYFLQRYAKRLNKTLVLPTAVIAKMKQYAWPGNIAELEIEMERAAALAEVTDDASLSILKDEAIASILAKRTAARTLGAGAPPSAVDLTTAKDLETAIAALERRFYEPLYEKYERKVTKEMAAEAGVAANTLRKKLEDLNIIPKKSARTQKSA